MRHRVDSGMTGTVNNPRYKDRAMQKMYDTCLALAADRTSELFHQTGEFKGEPREGAGARCYFWRGYRGVRATCVPGSLGQACYMAGKEFARTEGTVGNPRHCIDWSDAYAYVREMGRPIVCEVNGEVGRCFPSGRYEPVREGDRDKVYRTEEE